LISKSSFNEDIWSPASIDEEAGYFSLTQNFFDRCAQPERMKMGLEAEFKSYVLKYALWCISIWDDRGPTPGVPAKQKSHH
jgi:hypothetical protein